MKVNFSKKNSIKLIFVIIIAVGIYYFFSQPVVESLSASQGQQILDIFIDTKNDVRIPSNGQYTNEQIDKVKKIVPKSAYAGTEYVVEKAISDIIYDPTYMVTQSKGAGVVRTLSYLKVR